MQCFLKTAEAIREEGDEIMRNRVAEIRELSLDAEDVIATFAVKIALRRRGGIDQVFKRCFCIFNESVARHKVGLEIKAVNRKLASLRISLETYGGIQSKIALGESSTSVDLRRSFPSIVEEDVIGLDKEVDRVVNQRHFKCIAWAYVSQNSQNCKQREVWEEILIQLLPPESTIQKEEVEKMKLGKLVEELERVQSQNKCLVILDDIWEGNAWDTLSAGFPNVIATRNSKILTTSRKTEVTTRIQEVALHSDQQCFNLELRFLTKEESFELFHKKASRRMEEFKLSSEMMELGEVEEETLLDVGMSYLDEQRQRCMIQVGQLTGFSRRVKFYRLHDLVRDLCLLKAQEENFVKVVLIGEDSASAASSSSSSTTIRRLGVHCMANQTVDAFPPNLTHLNLHTSLPGLKEDPMPTLERLSNLRSLTVDGEWKEMVCSAGGFPQLIYLEPFCKHGLEEWRVERGAMSGLLHLSYRGASLKEIPDGLRFVTTLREFEIYWASQELKDRLREGGEDFSKIQHVHSMTIH
ncbi:hypothetical protein RHGRI_005871 [Rhododendron griersonianum]|uniref:NB-ARC domain-containing protein n=1 Tax=Rhododendron griersonianum TaxID=479676 RepID=A0AAV6LGH3_9ERIC|nr:hypothetical protein RHGRI_005871 [Rhododendron griersonianum]